jgi:hypothetical protein
VLKLLAHGLLDPDGVHAHFRDDCPRVRRLHPGEMRSGFALRRAHCPACTALAERKNPRAASSDSTFLLADAVSAAGCCC